MLPIAKTMRSSDLMFQIAQRPSIYVLDTPGVLVPSISDIETGLKLALAGNLSIEVIYPKYYFCY